MPDTQADSIFIPYPAGLLKQILRVPLWLYQAGFGPVLGWLPFLILTTRGRRTGLPRHTVLEYRRHGSKFYIISGWGEQAHWYKNLLADDQVTIQYGRLTIPARAVKVTDPAEALRAVYMFRRGSPLADVVLSRMSSADRIDLKTLTEVASEFTVVRLDRQAGTPRLPSAPAYPLIAPFVAIISLILLILWLFGHRKNGA